MSLTFPLATNIFFDKLRLKGGFIVPDFGKEYSEGADGTIYDKDLRPALWTADFETIQQPHQAINQLQASINGMGESTYTFYAYNPIVPYPQGDPDGSIMGAATPSISATLSGGARVSIKNLPPHYPITKGDMFALTFGSSPVFQTLHQVVEDGATTNGSGLTTFFTVFPYIPAGAVADTPVNFLKAPCIMSIRPGTVKWTRVDRYKSSMAFTAVQRITA